MKKVFICSPYRGELARNIQYAKACVFDSIRRGEAPFAPHLLYPRILDDADPDERETGMAIGQVWMAAADLIAVYEDLGISEGMRGEIEWAANRLRIPMARRMLDPAETLRMREVEAAL